MVAVVDKMGVVTAVRGNHLKLVVTDRKRMIDEDDYEDLLNGFLCEIDNLKAERFRKKIDGRSTPASRKQIDKIYSLAIKLVKEDLDFLQATYTVREGV